MEVSFLISFLNDYLRKAKLETSVRLIELFSKSRIPIYKSEVLGKTWEKASTAARRSRT